MLITVICHSIRILFKCRLYKIALSRNHSVHFPDPVESQNLHGHAAGQEKPTEELLPWRRGRRSAQVGTLEVSARREEPRM